MRNGSWVSFGTIFPLITLGDLFAELPIQWRISARPKRSIEDIHGAKAVRTAKAGMINVR